MNNIKKIIGIFLIGIVLFPSVFAEFLSAETITGTKAEPMLYTEQQRPVIIEPTQEYVDQQQTCMCPCKCQVDPPVMQVPQIDVVFVIDSTGSMSDEIRTIKTHIINIVEEVRRGNPRPDLRIGIVSYRDYQPEDREYVFRQYDLTRDVDSALNNLRAIEANGGGDHPEAVETALHVAINKMNWNSNAKKLVFLVGDAAPHGYGAGDRSFPQGSPEGYNYKNEIEYARAKGITIYAISCSGMDPAGDRIWRDIAKMTGGSYDQLSYQRRVVEEYYEEQGISEEWIPEAKASADYDAATGTILTNSLGDMAKGKIMAEAESMGVSYDERPTTSDPEGKDSWLDTGDITGNVMSEPVPRTSKQANVFSRMWSRMLSWT